jgi:Co/Zn/Cd efflux system component
VNEGGGVDVVEEEDPQRFEREPYKNERTRRIHEVYVPAFSVVTLVVVTVVLMGLAAQEIRSGGDDNTDVNYMFAFASVNTVVDATCISLFYYRREDILHNRSPSFTGEPEHRSPRKDQKRMCANCNLNMFAAFTHIGSDTLRTIAIFVAAIMASTTGAKSSLCDAWAAIVVSITVLVALLPLCREIYHSHMGTR